MRKLGKIFLLLILSLCWLGAAYSEPEPNFDDSGLYIDSATKPFSDATRTKLEGNLRAPLKGLIPKADFLLEPGLSAAEARKALFTRYQVVVVIDKSQSMATPDCPGGLSRWEWCREQTANLAKAAASYGSGDGITVVVFSDDFIVYRHAGLDMIAQIFHNNEPYGATNTAAALQDQLDEYFMQGTSKPLLIAVITDGCPNSPEAVKKCIAQATARMQDPHQAHITFLQVGGDPEGYMFALDLDRNLVREGARYDIVSSKTFDQLERTGVIGALIDAITRPSKATIPH